jgi:hypothetical protein
MPTEAQRTRDPSDELWAVDNYLASVGILASEGNRRSIERGYGLQRGDGTATTRLTLAQIKQAALREAYKNPRRARAFQRVYRWVR